MPDINVNYYDIESLSNVFTLANYRERDNEIDIYYLVDDDKLYKYAEFQKNTADAIRAANKNFNGGVCFYDLHTHEACEKLAETFGLSDARYINNPNQKSSYPKRFRITCDTDPEYKEHPEKYPYLAGYNSTNYDTTMLSVFLYETFWIMDPTQRLSLKGKEKADYEKYGYKLSVPTASKMRDVNNCLFEPTFTDSMPSFLTREAVSGGIWSQPNYSDSRWTIRKNMLMSGRQLDVSNLNEKQRKVGLKRLLGMMGFQILESTKLAEGQDTIETREQLCDLIAYNCSDVINLKELFSLDYYQSQFDLKRQLLETYPELVYEQQADPKHPKDRRDYNPFAKDRPYKPEISPEHVRRDRLFIDSTSSQFAQKSLCPYGHLKDMPVVSFMYPSEEKAKELGIKPVNVLEEDRKFFESLFPDPVKFKKQREEFYNIYNYYKSIEGKNFNESDAYMQDMTDAGAYVTPSSLSEIKKYPNCIPYYDKDGNPTSCFATFSTGGVHGAEYNKQLYDADMLAWEEECRDLAYVQSVYPDPVACRKAKTIEMPDGRTIQTTSFLKSGKKVAESEYKNPAKDEPKRFVIDKKDVWKLNPKYVYTSFDPANHEDFTSYYPNLLRMMMAFWNPGLGRDRYGDIFQQKQDYGKIMKDKKRPAVERAHYKTLREGTKLILNSASGAGDATFDNNIRMNNTIISMRIIGQLFSWRIGQAQAFRGSKITSTNTDGLYSVMEKTLNDKILAEESADIGVEIEPEPLYLISKDTNNRIEASEDLKEIESASGGTLACRKGPVVTKALAHPAIIDWAISEYLMAIARHDRGLMPDKPFDNAFGMEILKSAWNKFHEEYKDNKFENGDIHWLRMFQNVVASSSGSVRYIYGLKDSDKNTPLILPNYNRAFYVNEKVPDTMHLWAATARVVTSAQAKTRSKNHLPETNVEAMASYVLSKNGVSYQNTPEIKSKDIVTVKVSNIDEHWNVMLENHSLHELSAEEISMIHDNLDFDAYLTLFRDCYEKNWRNNLPYRKYITFIRDGKTEAIHIVHDGDPVSMVPARPGYCWRISWTFRNIPVVCELEDNFFTDNINGVNETTIKDFTAEEVRTDELANELIAIAKEAQRKADLEAKLKAEKAAAKKAEREAKKAAREKEKKAAKAAADKPDMSAYQPKQG